MNTLFHQKATGLSRTNQKTAAIVEKPIADGISTLLNKQLPANLDS
ncbi:19486_t:CDS:2, partial [Gigaspora margarita]